MQGYLLTAPVQPPYSVAVLGFVVAFFNLCMPKLEVIWFGVIISLIIPIAVVSFILNKRRATGFEKGWLVDAAMPLIMANGSIRIQNLRDQNVAPEVLLVVMSCSDKLLTSLERAITTDTTEPTSLDYLLHYARP